MALIPHLPLFPLFLSLLLLHGTVAFYLPGVAPLDFRKVCDMQLLDLSDGSVGPRS
jgi:hypothetical protein